MRLFSEEKQAEHRRPWLRSEKGRRIAVFIAVPLGAYAVLAVVGLLGGPTLPLIPLPDRGGAEVISPVAGPPPSRSTDRVYPPIPAETPLPSTTLPTSTPTDEPTGQPTGDPSGPVTVGSADRPTRADDRRTVVSSTPVPADERTVPPTAQPTRTPPSTTQPTRPTTTTTTQPPTTPWTPSPTPTQPTGDPDHQDPTLGDVLRALLGGLTP
ncbi:hypothetical protein EV643_101120 [Kribbella sp. VKM Ac-2527]|uniref:Uncharacterized protein n=1 Tax=Kribbella caucasensis TaxID=2512215 RepID=A0A4R6KPT5_9ACTN|nr:hypothetical protein [Kribbella sp. VKM Ac-2527]TDO54339.1 hypothetical protein EV643_101120 [Kribbella sp. VKM Ac-2527]